MTRALATIEHVSTVSAHDNADALELLTVRGWQVVAKLGEFAAGDAVVYFEIDTMLDVADPRFEFLAPRGVRTDVRDDFAGHVLKTVKLRGQISQGLVLPVADFEAEVGARPEPGTDVTEVLGLRKWDPPLPAALSGQAIGQRPAQVPKTDAERIQNFDLAGLPSTGWAASEKIDGSSTSYLLEAEGSLRVCTRNLELAEAGQAQWQLADALDLESHMQTVLTAASAQRVVLQGELAGPRLQGNPLQLQDLRFFAFRLLIDDVDMPTAEWPAAIAAIAAPALDIGFPSTTEEALALADGLVSVAAPGRRPEGIVWRYEGDDVVPERIVKAISNRYLLKQKD